MEKLIRDNIIDIALSKWEKLNYRIISSTQEKVAFLLSKLDEEFWEFKDAITQNEKIEEAGDVLEVLEALIKTDNNEGLYQAIQSDFIDKCLKVEKLDINIIYTKKEEKKKEKWWFEKGIILIF